MASQYNVQPKDKYGITMLGVDKFPFTRKQTRDNEFIPSTNLQCTTNHMQATAQAFYTALKAQLPLSSDIWAYKKQRWCGVKGSGRWSSSTMRCHQWCSFLYTFHADDVKPEIRLYPPWLLANPKRESALGMGLCLLSFTNWPSLGCSWLVSGVAPSFGLLISDQLWSMTIHGFLTEWRHISHPNDTCKFLVYGFLA